MTKIHLFVSSAKYSYMERRVFPGEGRTFGWHGKGKTDMCAQIIAELIPLALNALSANSNPENGKTICNTALPGTCPAL